MLLLISRAVSGLLQLQLVGAQHVLSPLAISAYPLRIVCLT